MFLPIRYLVGLAVSVILIAVLFVSQPWSTQARGAAPTASNTMLGCDVTQQAVVRHTVANNELQVAVQCVNATGAVPIRAQDEFGGASVYRTANPVYAAAPVARAPQVRRTSAPRTVRTAEPTRSWKKTALVIGGSAGAGAGIGAIAGGKKGALIGAAIGGGAASLFEAIKR